MISPVESTYSLSRHQIEDYQQKGHIILRDVANSELISQFEPIISDCVRELNRQNKPLEERDTYGKAFIQITNLWKRNEAVRAFVLAKRFARIAAELMGVPSVRIYHDQALFKEPEGGHTPWHQDQIYWPLDTDKTITMWMPLVPISEEVGSMTFASESHKLGYINKLVISDESHRTLAEFIDSKGLKTKSYGGMNAGDATFHAGWTLHSAPGNPTDHMRKVMTIIYYADGTRVAEPDSYARKTDLRNWLPGVQPGELAASPLNPIVYSTNG
ncbi:phytanoyl-CoA dioxygenase family protein [Paenibacillus sp. NPDC056579]|uniref:phytanoyl-CoA dioxygenase family protein n=1 Tax=Paenibacillus sp. NPDC056579 TaxID=3345871 RepID=UPI0036C41CE3